jgi:DNA polymerase elongation subunit (family B)
MYTNVFQYGNKILVRGYDHNGKPYKQKVNFEPTFFINNSKENNTSEWKTLEGRTVYPLKPGSIKECKEFIERYKDVEGFDVYGLNQYEYQYITDRYPEEIIPNTSLIKICTIDIETKTEFGFPDINAANEEILLISIMDNRTKQIRTYGTGEFNNENPNVTYVKCASESQMLRMFLDYWNLNTPDVITGWNVEGFDIPYLVHRLRRLGLDENELSPWKVVFEHKKYQNSGIRAGVNTDKGEPVLSYTLNGIAVLDYMAMYKKFTFTARESYRLDHIAEIELGENKLDNPYDTFKEFYTNDFDKFVKYNIHDVYLVDKLEDRLKLIILAFTLAYKAKVNFQDVYSPVRTWDILIYNYLTEKKIAVPLKSSSKAVPFVGGFVKDPIAGLHNWVCSFDLTSLYPHIIMGYNMSPETISDLNVSVSVEDLVSKSINLDILKGQDVAMAANGSTYRRDVRGFLPELMQSLYNQRKTSKNEMLKLQKEYEKTKNPATDKEIARLSTLEQAIKVTLNSGYGAVTNAYFRYFDIRIGEGITKTGQLASQWVSRKLNEFMNKALKTKDVDYVIYSDTDSCYLSLEKVVNEHATDKDTTGKIQFMTDFAIKVLQPYIDKSYQEMADYTNAYEQMMKMKLEVIADVGIFYKKKKYLLNVHSSEGVVYSEPKLKVKGLSMIQSSTPEICRDSLRKSIKVALSGSEKEVREFNKGFRNKFNAHTVEEISFPRSVNGIDVYGSSNGIYSKGTPIAVRGALLYNHHLKRLKLDKKYTLIHNGDKIKFIFLRKPNPFHENVIAFPTELPKEFGLHDYVDYDTQYEKAFKDSLTDLVEPMGWTVDDVSNLEDFFS